MSDYFFIQSQDPFTEIGASRQYRLARQLHEAGHGVSVLLVQNGVTPGRAGAVNPDFDELLHCGVKLLADAFSLRQREIDHAHLKNGILVAGVEQAIEAMLAGHKIIWH